MAENTDKSADLVGQTISHFHIREKLGSGASGVVCRADDVRLGRTVALKFYHDQASTSDTRQRVLEEARLAASVHHPNICTIFEVDEHDGVPFIAMAYIKGTPVSELLKREQLPVARAVGMIIQAARGLEAAHRNGIVHRDIKTENMVVDEHGNLVLMDFGVAKRAGRDEAGAPTLVGTAGYMAPEQANLAANVDHRADLWALGVCLFETIAGALPFQGEYVESVMYSILNEEPRRVSELRRDVPVGVDKVIRKALTKDVDRRYQSATEMIADLERPAGSADTLDETDERAPSIAVLPFLDLSEGADNEYFCDGIADEIINDLTRIGGLRVVSRTSSFAFKGKHVDIRNVGRRLGVDALLEGSVRKQGRQVRIVAQLIDASNGYHLWSEQFDRTLEDVFTIQEQIARRIAESLEVHISELEFNRLAQVRTSSVEAYESYLRGRTLFYGSSRDSIEAACDMFGRAIEQDPDYARSYAGLADCYSYLNMYFDADRRNLRLADANSKIALQLDPHLAEARASRGLALSLSGRYPEAENEFEAAIALNPRLFEAYYFYARTCFAQGKFEEAVECYHKAVEVNPNDYQAASLLGFTYRELGQMEEAEAAARESLVVIERHLQLYPSDSRAWYLGASSLLDVGDVSRAREWVDRAMEIAPNDPYNTYGGACFFSRTGDIERALELFEIAIRNGFAHRDWIEHDGDLDPIRNDPRYVRLLEELQ